MRYALHIPRSSLIQNPHGLGWIMNPADWSSPNTDLARNCSVGQFQRCQKNCFWQCLCASRWPTAILSVNSTPAWGSTGVQGSNGDHTEVKRESNGGQTGVIRRSNMGQTGVKRRSNGGQMEVKRRSNGGQAAVKRRPAVQNSFYRTNRGDDFSRYLIL